MEFTIAVQKLNLERSKLNERLKKIVPNCEHVVSDSVVLERLIDLLLYMPLDTEKFVIFRRICAFLHDKFDVDVATLMAEFFPISENFSWYKWLRYRKLVTLTVVNLDCTPNDWNEINKLVNDCLKLL